MRCTALPLQVTAEGKFTQQEPLDAVIQLVRAMAISTATTWPHAPWFGLLELFEEAGRRERQDHDGLKDAINAALLELGATGLRVLSVVSGGTGPEGRRSFQLTFADTGGDVFTGQVAAA